MSQSNEAILKKFKEHTLSKQRNPTPDSYWENENRVAQEIHRMTKDIENRVSMTKEKFHESFSL